MTEGKLLVVNNKTLQVQFVNAKGKPVQFNVKESELSATLMSKRKDEAAKLNGVEVEFEVVGGQPQKIREKGQAFQSHNMTTATSGKTERSPSVQNSKDNRPNSEGHTGDFHNPYNFVPALPRSPERFTTDLAKELGDRSPDPHGVYCSNRWSGRITVTLKTITPLLIPDAANLTEDENGHKTYPVRLVDGKPYLPPTSIKGMLRSAYETVTNSRLSVFHGHDDRLAYRMPAKVGPIPARVERQGNDLVLRIMEEPSLLGHAGKLPRYEKSGSPPDKDENEAAIKYEDSSRLPQHGDAVWVELNNGVVTRIRSWTSESLDNSNWQKGWVCITGANISGKQYERVFIEKHNNPVIPITQKMQAFWRELITNYQETHKKDLEKRRKNGQQPQDYLGSEPGKTGWSRHVYDSREKELREGILCYVEFSNGQVSALIPVSISRRLYLSAPDKLLDHSLKPALDIENLSPADRVFGWVRQEKAENSYGAYKGNLRVSAISCSANNPIQEFPAGGLPLAILGQPKPQQARFYVAQDEQGTPLAKGSPKQTGFQNNNGLRGRKVYPHPQKLPEGYWSDPTEDRTQREIEGYFQEYRRPKLRIPRREQRDDQNRSILAWVKPDVTFSFTIDITNLSNVELGALLWLLNLPEKHYHRLGGGKPLGFGSIRLDIDWDNTDLRKGEDWQQYYRDLLRSLPNQDFKGAEVTVLQFKEAFEQAYGNGNKFDDIHLVQAFCCCAKGFEDGLPIHYPRVRKPGQTGAVPPRPEGKSFEWFVANERTGGPKVALSPLWSEGGLPILPSK
jgi:CRISPR-associated protein (TIGR03986 family)